MSRLFAEKPKAEPRDIDTCPVHWNNVPILPSGNHAKQDRDGSGKQYRYLHNGDWWLLRYLPPYDGRISAMGAVNKCFRSLEAFKKYLEVGR